MFVFRIYIFAIPNSPRQNLQKGLQSRLILPQRAENGFFEVSTRAGEVHGTPFGDEDKVTGDDCFICRLYLRTIEQLDEILSKVTERAETSTAIVKSTNVIVDRR